MNIYVYKLYIYVIIYTVWLSMTYERYENIYIAQYIVQYIDLYRRPGS